MKRLPTALALAFAALLGCARQAPLPDAFPEILGAWRRAGAVRTPPLAPPPDALPANGVTELRAAAYEGPGALEARLYGFATPAGALDAAQRWTPRADTVFFYRDRFFVVVEWQQADKNALREFVGALQKRFPPARQNP